jgi:hypothetical protein
MSSCRFKEIIVPKFFEIKNILLGLDFMNSCHFKEIVVFENFEVKNGLLGLDRDVYLSIVKFLNSPITRKV